MSLLGAALGGFGAAAGQIADTDIKLGAQKDLADQKAKADQTLQSQAAQIQQQRDAFVNQLRMQADVAQQQGATQAYKDKAGFDTSPEQVAAQAALVGAQTKAKNDATPLKLNPGETVRDPVTGVLIAKGDGMTSAEATLAATRMRIAADRADAAASAAAGGGAQKVTYQTITDGNGNQTIVAVPTTIQPGQAVTGTPVVNPDGSPVGKGNKPNLNQEQSQALLYGTRMGQSDKILQTMSSKGVDTPSYLKMVAESLPVIGGVAGRVTNAYTSPDQQSVEQAQRDFVNATLRRESGAAISETEFDSARKQYFPTPGDSDQVKAQKAANRSLAIKGILAAVPEGQRNSLTPSAAPASPAISIDVGAMLNSPTPAQRQAANRRVLVDY